MAGIRTSRIRVWLALLALLTAGGISWADLTSITYTPSPIIVGSSTTYTAHDNNTPQIQSWKWEYRCPSSPNWTAANGGTSTCVMIEGRAGNYDVRCTATFMPGGYPQVQKPDQSLTTTVTINPPNSDGVTAGLNVPTSIYGGECMVDFQVYTGGVKVGGYLQGSPDERVRRPNKMPPEDTGWLLGPGAPFLLNQGVIKDIKTYNRDPQDPADMANWNAIANGAVIDDFFQQNRIRAKDSCNTDREYYFPEHHFQRIKVDANNWKLIEL